MDQEFSPEALSLAIDPEFDSEIFQQEGEWGRRGLPRGRPGASFRPRGPRPPRFRPIPPAGKPGRASLPPRRPWTAFPVPYRYPVETPYSVAPAGSEHIRWVQDCLNQVLGLQLAVTGIMGQATRSAVRSFQRGQGLRVSGIVGPDTVDALRATCGNRAGPLSPQETEFDGMFNRAWSKALPRGRTEMELPRHLVSSWNRLLGGIPPVHRSLWSSSRCHSLTNARLRAPTSGGIYMIVWDRATGPTGYVGMSNNLRRRFGNYFWYARALGLDPGRYGACWRVIGSATRGAIESAHRDALRAAGLVTNQEELETEGELWGDKESA